MARKKKEEIVFNETIIDQPLEDVMHDSMIPYAEYVVMERALPRVEDGLKPVQRRILYTMMDLSNTPDKPHKKSARITGDAMGKYHPHGDTSIYDAMVRLSQDFSVRAPLVDGHGNFGSIDGDSAAAMRYTEVRMTPLALELLRDIEKDTVPFRLNFDDSLKEPCILPGRYPNLLVNGAMGIAVGLATNIPSHNLGEVIDAVVLRMDNPKTTLEDIMEVLPAPDFPTGGYLVGSEGLLDAYRTGRGKIKIRSKCTLEKASGGKTNIVINEVPYQVNKANMLEKILRLREAKKGILNDITDIRDESDRDGIRAVIEVKKDSDANKVLAYLYKYSDLQVNYGINMVVIADSKPQQLGLLPILDYYIDHQKEVVTRRTRYDLEKAEAREHILAGLLIAINNIDKVIRIIKASSSTQEAKRSLMNAFDLTGVQSQAILDMRLARLTALEVEKLEAELAKVKELIAYLRSILRSPRKLRSVIRKEILEIKKKHNDKRRTVIMDDSKVKTFNAEDFIIVEDIVVTVTRDGFVKRLTQKTYGRSNTKVPFDDLSHDDRMILELHGSTKQSLYIFTSGGLMFQLPADTIGDARWVQKGTHLSAILKGFDSSQRIVSAMLLDEMPADGHILFVSKNGMAKRSSTEQYQTRNKKFVACGITKGDELTSVTMCKRGRTITMITHRGMGLTVRPTQLSVMGRAAKGMRIMVLGADDYIMSSFETDGEGDLLLLTDAGYGKRIMTIVLPARNKATKGQAIIKFNKNNSNGECIILAQVVRENTQLFVTQKSGQLTQTASDEFPIQSDIGRGVPIIPVVLGDDITTIR